MIGSTKRGATSLGLTITAQPANSGGIACSVDNINGAFHGPMTPATGYGLRIVSYEMLGAPGETPERFAWAKIAGAIEQWRMTEPMTMSGATFDICPPPVSALSASTSRDL